jgi:Dynamin family
MASFSDSASVSDDTPVTSESSVDDSDAPIGLSDPQFVSQKRGMLDAVNRLRAGGYGPTMAFKASCCSPFPFHHSAHLDLDIPVIVVLGSQSAGKSSLIEAISGITLPRSSGTCTRFAPQNLCLHVFTHVPICVLKVSDRMPAFTFLRVMALRSVAAECHRRERGCTVATPQG